jgi:hypothetical protein
MPHQPIKLRPFLNKDLNEQYQALFGKLGRKKEKTGLANTSRLKISHSLAQITK